jgi:hypothetical protein
MTQRKKKRKKIIIIFLFQTGNPLTFSRTTKNVPISQPSLRGHTFCKQRVSQ